MFGKINYITGNVAHVANMGGNTASDLMNLHVIFESAGQRVLGEITEINKEVIKIQFLGEFNDDRYVNGVIRKPSLASTIRVISEPELLVLIGTDNEESFTLGKSATYKNYTVYPKINDFFSNHFSILGNSGSGKSCGVARIVQNVFNTKAFSYNANLFIFDAYGEYKNAFSEIDKYNPNYAYKFITSNLQDSDDTILEIPINLLTLDDMALLLQANSHTQLPIIERMLRLAKIFSQESEESLQFKNHLIAKALLAILFSNKTTANKKNEIFTVIEVCNTYEFNFDSTIQGLGYTRSFSECFEIDSNGYFGESVLITEYILRHINDELENIPDPETYSYSIRDLANALNFTLISEGFQSNTSIADDATMLQVRINALLSNKVGQIFVNNGFISLNDYVSAMVMKNGKKAQIININLEDIDDIYAKVLVKILCRFLFDFTKDLKQRASVPFHLLLEEAHRYIQLGDIDTFLLGYNIFDRIAKEGRKYGTILGIISQRPVEISDTVIAQISNFLILKMTHPKDIKYIEEMLPNISSDVIEKMKVLQPGSCVSFGSAFKIPMIIKLELPNPLPYSSNCDISKVWRIGATANNTTNNSTTINTVLNNEIQGIANSEI